MATTNKNVSIYLSPELEKAVIDYCIENNITRKNAKNETVPAIGTAIVKYLTATLLSTLPLETVASEGFEERIKRLEEKIEGIDRSKAKLPKLDKTQNDYLTFKIFNELHQTNFDRRTGAEAIRGYLDDTKLPYEYDSASFRFYPYDKDG
jgi:hypothetical protein